MRIAKYTGIWSAACHVFIDEVFYYKTTKFFTYIKNVMSKSMFNRRLSRIVEAVYITTPCFLFTSAARAIVPGFHSNADYFITLVMKHQRGDGTIDTTA